VALESRVERAQTAVSPVLPIANTTTPQTNATTVAGQPAGLITPIEKPSAVNGPTTDLASIQMLLQQMTTAITELGQRKMDVSVVTQIDGRKVAEAVYKDMQDKKIRNYETLS
jgi:hypothetical protein